MPAKRLHPRVIREVIRVRSLGFSVRRVSRSVSRSVGAVWKTIQRAEKAGLLRWPLPMSMNDEELEQALYGEKVRPPGSNALPDWESVHKKLKHPEVTRRKLWKEYSAAHPENHYSYPQFCKLYSSWFRENKMNLQYMEAMQFETYQVH